MYLTKEIREDSKPIDICVLTIELINKQSTIIEIKLTERFLLLNIKIYQCIWDNILRQSLLIEKLTKKI
jgi:hypothetical protein